MNRTPQNKSHARNLWLSKAFRITYIFTTLMRWSTSVRCFVAYSRRAKKRKLIMLRSRSPQSKAIIKSLSFRSALIFYAVAVSYAHIQAHILASSDCLHHLRNLFRCGSRQRSNSEPEVGENWWCSCVRIAFGRCAKWRNGIPYFLSCYYRNTSSYTFQRLCTYKYDWIS